MNEKNTYINKYTNVMISASDYNCLSDADKEKFDIYTHSTGVANYSNPFLKIKNNTMKIWGTSIYAKHNITGEIREFCGQNVEAPTRELAIAWCQHHCGYLHVNDEIVAEIPCKEGSYEPDFDNMVDYENIQNN